MDKPIYVTSPNLPPLTELLPYLEEIWKNRQLTNNGPFHKSLEEALCKYLGVEFISLFANGTIALISALKALQLSGEIITTPYSFVATSHALLWNGITPVFVDIDPVSFNLSPSKIEAAITEKTTAIMPVHCYGQPCDVVAIEKIADKYNLKVIYDAAHAFGVRDPGGSILRHGNLSVLSFHATKVFNTFEGGAIVCSDASSKQRIDQIKNFGILDEVTVADVGINGKMSEINAAFGLLQLKYMESFLCLRKQIDNTYREILNNVMGIRCLDVDQKVVANYSYFPIIVDSDYPLSRDQLYDRLKDNGIYSRRYFYPLISDFEIYRGLKSASFENLPIASSVSKKVLCLPIYPDLDEKQATRIARLIAQQ